MMHPFDTQKNEGLNTAVLYGAPKHKKYSTTMSLASWVATRAAINSIGYVIFLQKSLRNWEFLQVEIRSRAGIQFIRQQSPTEFIPEKILQKKIA